jgi:hypothetical protein
MTTLKEELMKNASLLSACAILVGLSTPAFSEETQRILSTLTDGTTIISGQWRKQAAGPIDIPFNHTFSSPPVVVVTSVWHAGVGSIETVTRVDSDRFQVNSGNAAADYFVNWIAMGK